MADGKSARRIVVEGFVQGVGFRPGVFRLAQKHGISGGVKNCGGAVEIHAEGDDAALAGFLDELAGGLPEPCRIEALRISGADLRHPNGFSVEASVVSPRGGRILPDLPPCEDCERELRQPGRREGHPFVTCTVCGPRYSLIRALPYDRANTTMAAFDLCPECGAEYGDPRDRRFHAETICCNRCGPALLYRGADGTREGAAALDACAERLRGGGVALIKGVGGYHLACSPDAAGAVAAVRRIKGRDAKPFAVMFRDIGQVEEYCRADAEERALLLSSARPIVPLPARRERPFARETLMGDRRCGCFLPYSPLHVLLLERIGPLIMTSANASGSPILYDDAEAMDFFDRHRPEVTAMVHHRRAIARPVEDSVAAVVCGRPQVIRRSRGYAPAPLTLPFASPDLLAFGGDLKSAVCAVRGDRAYVSQHLGDLADAAAFRAFERTAEEFQALFGCRPRLAVCDRHPGYLSTAAAEASGLPVLRVQHHHAHIASVMAEHGTPGPVIGVAFDGTGYGDDGAVWGGEFLRCVGASCRRLGHLEYFPLVGGDEAVRNASQTAACLLLHAGLPVPERLFPSADVVRAAADAGFGVSCSSMGRLFDAMAAILGLCSYNAYEGMCATALQQCAERAEERGIAPAGPAFSLAERDGMIVVGYRDILIAAGGCPDSDDAVGALALGFHHAAADLVARVVARLRGGDATDDVALSGGVFQNALLQRLCRRRLESAGMRVLVNRQVPANDGGIALGQAYVGGWHLTKSDR